MEKKMEVSEERTDPPSRVKLWMVSQGPSAPYKGFDGNTPIYVRVTDDCGNAVMLPCHDVEFTDGKVVFMVNNMTKEGKKNASKKN